MITWNDNDPKPAPGEHESAAPITLTDLPPGTRGTITAINAEGPLKRRLMDLGILVGATVEMEKQAPLGDPLQIRVQNTRIALRKSETSTILIDTQGIRRHGRIRARHRAGR